jgi:hypothetical protein
MSAAWSALGLAFVATVVALFTAVIGLHDRAIILLIPMLMFAFYGAGWWVSYMVARQPAHATMAAGCLALMLVTGLLAGVPELWLAHGLGLLLLVVAPGIAILRGAKGVGTDDRV